jgi:hypothetical protein
MHKNKLILLCGLLLASPMVAIAENEIDTQQQKNSQNISMWRAYYNRFSDLKDAAMATTLGVVVGALSWKFCSTQLTLAQQYSAEKNICLDQYISEKLASTNLENTSFMRDLLKDNFLKTIPANHPYCELAQKEWTCRDISASVMLLSGLIILGCYAVACVSFEQHQKQAKKNKTATNTVVAQV